MHHIGICRKCVQPITGFWRWRGWWLPQYLYADMLICIYKEPLENDLKRVNKRRINISRF